MSHAENRVEWCFRKAADETARGRPHRGLVAQRPDRELARRHLAKAEHNARAIISFKKTGFSDWSASAAFYTAYHCFLAILAKRGYESRNQECTFALIARLIETGELRLDRDVLRRFHALDPDAVAASASVTGLREAEQYGVSLSLEEKAYERVLDLARDVLDRTKTIIEE